MWRYFCYDSYGLTDIFKFKILNNIPDANGKCKFISGQYNVLTGELVNLNLEVQIDKGYMDSSSSLAVAKTILHECIHAYLTLKQYGCNQGTNFGELDDVEMSELLTQYYLECAPEQGDHEFMFNFMVPTMQDVLSEIKDSIIPHDQQEVIQETDFYDISQLVNGPLIESTPFSWDQLYYYLCITGLQEAEAYQTSIANNPLKVFLRNWYNYELTNLSKNCYD